MLAQALITEEWPGAFSVMVEYDHDEPFGFLRGPDKVSAEHAVRWARQRVSRVVITTADGAFSAGVEPVDGLPIWPSRPPDQHEAPPPVSPPKPWVVLASLWWGRRDREAVAQDIAGELESQASRTVDLRYDDENILIEFDVQARDAIEAHEVAYRDLASAWRSLNVHAVPGEDWDMPDVVARPLKR